MERPGAGVSGYRHFSVVYLIPAGIPESARGEESVTGLVVNPSAAARQGSDGRPLSLANRGAEPCAEHLGSPGVPAVSWSGRLSLNLPGARVASCS